MSFIRSTILRDTAEEALHQCCRDIEGGMLDFKVDQDVTQVESSVNELLVKIRSSLSDIDTTVKGIVMSTAKDTFFPFSLVALSLLKTHADRLRAPLMRTIAGVCGSVKVHEFTAGSNYVSDKLSPAGGPVPLSNCVRGLILNAIAAAMRAKLPRMGNAFGRHQYGAGRAGWG